MLPCLPIDAGLNITQYATLVKGTYVALRQLFLIQPLTAGTGYPYPYFYSAWGPGN